MISSEIRAEARKNLQGKWGTGVFISLIYFIFSLIVTLIIEKTGAIGTLLDILYFVVSIPIAFGLTISMIKLKRSEQPVGPFDFFTDGFANFKRSWTLTGNILKKLIVYVILTFIGIIMLGISLAFASISVLDSLTAATSLGNLSGTALIFCVIGLLLYLVSLFLMIPKSFLYVLSMYIGFDNPDMTSKEAVEKSAELMKGNRWRFFCLSFSFIGWIILSAFTLYIGLLWVFPYMQVSIVIFYEELIGKNNSNPIQSNKDENQQIDDGPIQTN